MNGLIKAISLFGTMTALAKELGTKKAVVHQWKVRGQVPPSYCPTIEKLTYEKGDVVLSEELNSTINWQEIRNSHLRSLRKNFRRKSDRRKS